MVASSVTRDRECVYEKNAFWGLPCNSKIWNKIQNFISLDTGWGYNAASSLNLNTRNSSLRGYEVLGTLLGMRLARRINASVLLSYQILEATQDQSSLRFCMAGGRVRRGAHHHRLDTFAQGKPCSAAS